MIKFHKSGIVVTISCMSLLYCGTAFAADPVELTLQDCIQMGLQNNHSIKESNIDVENAVWNLKENSRDKGPTVTWTSTAETVGGPMYDSAKEAAPSVNYGREFGNTVEVSLPIYSGGKLENNIKASKYGVNVADLTLENEKQTIKETVTKDYYSILKYKSEIDVYQDSVNDLQMHLTIVNAKFDNGTVAKSDVLSSEVSLANEQQSLTSAQNDYAVAVATLNNDIGLPTRTETTITDQLQYTKYNLALDDCVNYALLHRSDLLADKSEIEEYAADVEAEKAGTRPQVSLVVDKSMGGSKLFGSDHTSSDYWSTGVSASWNVFDNNVTDAKVKQKEATYRKAQEEELEKEDSVRLDVNTAYLDLITAEKNIHTSQESLDKAEHDYKIELIRYSAGVDTNLDVLDVEEKLREARGDYITALYDYNTSKASLDKAMGM